MCFTETYQDDAHSNPDEDVDRDQCNYDGQGGKGKLIQIWNACMIIRSFVRPTLER